MGRVGKYAAVPSSPPEGDDMKHVRKAKITPLPLSQMIPMVIVIMNESICSTMLMPFIGPFVAYLRGVPVNKAGYFSGMIVGVFMLGQVVSAKAWGRISDTYGRRFPIISGLFTSGVMMLGFGLSTNIWTLAVFRFFHGLFNGNVLVAKTMMADITDRTNQGGGFAFISLRSAFGFLIGPSLGGILYDPAHSTALSWAQIDEKGFLGTHPAFLTSFVVFMYTNIGMLVCTFLVRESNPKAQPLPGFVRFIYPCMWYRSKFFVAQSIEYEGVEEREEMDSNCVVVRKATVSSETKELTVVEEVTEDETGGDLSGGTHAASRDSMLPSREVRDAATNASSRGYLFSSLVATDEDVDLGRCGRRHREPDAATVSPGASVMSEAGFDTTVGASLARTLAAAKDASGDAVVVVGELRCEKPIHAEGDAATLSTRKQGVEPPPYANNEEAPERDEALISKFGYREAFVQPTTRFMLSQYMMLSATDMVARDCFPLWAVSTTSAGGLGLTSSQVSYILLANSAPCLLANLLFRIAERHFEDKMGLFRVGVFGAGTCVLLLPLNSYLKSSLWVYVLVFLCSAGRQMLVSWCYSLNTMLTARAAPPGHVGSIMGINQSCGALVRGIMPFIAAPLYAWSISGEHPFPFNHTLVFVASTLLFYSCWWRSYALRTDAVGHVQMV